MYEIYMYVPQTYISCIFMLMNISFLSVHVDEFKLFFIDKNYLEGRKKSKTFVLNIRS